MDDVGFVDRIDSVDSTITKGATGSRGNNIITTVRGAFNREVPDDLSVSEP
jgi:hypothetical protein